MSNQTKEKMPALGLPVATLTLILATSLCAQTPDNLTQVVSTPHVRGSTSGALGCFRQNPLDGKFYIGVFGAARSLRVYDPATDSSVEFVDADTVTGFELASDVPGGVTAAGTGVSGGVGIVSGLAFNPSTIELSWHNPQTNLDETITYPPGTLAYVLDGSTDVRYNNVYRPEYTKKLWRWDLRKAWAPTTAAPDYANAVNGNGVPVGAYGVADWNDIFTVVLTEKSLHQVSGSTSTSAVSMRFQLRTVDYTGPSGSFPVQQLLYMASGTTSVNGVYLFQPGDFDRDNDLDTDDVNLFLAALQTPIKTFFGVDSNNKLIAYESAENGFGQELRVVNPAALAGYLKFDLNANGLVNGKDKQILWRLRGLAPADFDADGDVDDADRVHFDAAVGRNTAYTTLVRPIGDLDRDGAINHADITAFTPCVTGPAVAYASTLPEGCTVNIDDEGLADADADLDRDGDVDQQDFGLLQRLIGTVPELVFKNMLYGDADLDNDHDVDTKDLTIFNGCYSGEGLPANPLCAD